MSIALTVWLAGWLLSLPVVAYLAREPQGDSPGVRGDFGPLLWHAGTRMLLAFYLWPMLLGVAAYQLARYRRLPECPGGETRGVEPNVTESPSDPEWLWLEVDEPPPGSDHRDALIRFAQAAPADPRWVERLRHELAPSAPPAMQGRYLNVLTLFPDHGVCALPEVLALLGDPDAWIRGWAVEDLRLLARHHAECVNPAEWVEAVWPLLSDWLPGSREDALTVLGCVVTRDPAAIDRRRLARAVKPMLADPNYPVRDGAERLLRAAGLLAGRDGVG